MAFCELKYFSKSLGKATATDVILPESRLDGPFSVYYLLHGLSDDHTMWQRRTSIERYVQDLPLMVVMPDGGRGFYCDAKIGMAWESSLIKDLIPYVDTLFQTRAAREGRCVGGLSMGGYGGVKLALKYPDLFVSGNSHSGAVAFAHRPIKPEPDNAWSQELSRIVGEDSAGGPDDIFSLAEGLEPGRRPALQIDCGVDDFLIEDNRALHAHLDNIDYPHEYAEYPGAHNWAYWDEHVRQAITFHARSMGIDGTPS